MRVSFPAHPSMLDGYPNLRRHFLQDTKWGRSEKQIFRLLDNPHYLRDLTGYIEGMLSHPEHGDFVHLKVKNRDYQQFQHDLYEVYLLDHLLRLGYTVEPCDTSKGGGRVPEFVATRGGRKLLIEQYSPTDIYGYEHLYEEVRLALKYSLVDSGFSATVHLQNEVDWEDPSRTYFPYDLHDVYNDDKVRRTLVGMVSDRFDEGLETRMPFVLHVDLLKDLHLRIEVRPLPNPKARQVVTHQGTTSYSSVLWFSMPTCGTWGFWGKVQSKVRRGQLHRDEHPGATTVLLLDLNGLTNRDAETLLGVGDKAGGYYNRRFYETVPRCLGQLLDPKDVDLVFPVLSGIGDDFVVGGCVFNPGGIDTSGMWDPVAPGPLGMTGP